MDNAIRVLERQENQNALLKAKLRSGHFQEWQVGALDSLGHPVFGDGIRKFDWSDWDSRKEFLASLPELLIKQFAISCAEHVLPIWTQEFPDDQRPTQAIQAAKDYLAGKITESELREKEDAAWAARAAWAAWSIAGAARAAWSIAGAAWTAAGAARATAWTPARAAAGAAWASWYAEIAADPSESEWQIQELTRMILCSTE